MYFIQTMNKEDAIEISKWKYDGIYEFYSHSGTNEEVERLLNGCYYSVKDKDGQLIGYYCFGTPSQVPNGHRFGAYDDLSYIDMGLGLKPQLTGKGIGFYFVRDGIEFAQKFLSKNKIRLTVATFNQRAIKIYEKVGFKKALAFDRVRSNGEIISFITMLKEI